MAIENSCAESASLNPQYLNSEFVSLSVSWIYCFLVFQLNSYLEHNLNDSMVLRQEEQISSGQIIPSMLTGSMNLHYAADFGSKHSFHLHIKDD